MPEEEFIIATFCLIDDLYHELFPYRIRSRGYDPKLSDSEAITIEIVGEWLGLYKDMVEAGLAVDSGKSITSGYCAYKVVRIMFG